MENFSRRELFKKFIPKHEKNAHNISTSDIENVEKEHVTLSRRSFLKFLGAMGTALAIEQIGVSTAEPQKDSEVNKKIDTKNQDVSPQVTLKQKSEDTSSHESKTEIEEDNKEGSYTETAIEQSLMIGAKYIAHAIFKKLKIEHGDKSMTDEEIIKSLRDYPIATLFASGVFVPVIEEALFRGLPSAFIDTNDTRRRWEIGIPTSLLFALVHNVSKEESGKLQFIKSVPINQFMGGLFYWYLMREKGYSHAVFAHSMNNAIPLSIGILLFKAFPEKKAVRITKKIFGMKEENRKYDKSNHTS